MKTSLASVIALALVVLQGQSASAQARLYNAPHFQGRGSESKVIDGVEYGSFHKSGFDTRVDESVGISLERETGKGRNGFAGYQGSIGSGHFTESGAFQKGKLGNLDVTNSVTGSTFVGTEANAKAGISKEGATVGLGAFSGGRASGRVGTDLGAVGYGATGEVWSGFGAEGGVHAGINAGKLKLGGELGAGLGVGGKVGVDLSVDVRPIENVAKNVGRTADRVTKDVDRAAKTVGRDVDRASKDVSRSVNRAAKDADNAFKSIGKIFK